MDNSWYSFDVSSGWLLLAIVGAFVLALLLYSKKQVPWGKPVNILMGFLRFLGIFLIILLLLNPVLQLFVNTEEPPKIVFAIDNSESVALRQSGPSDQEIQTEVIKLTTGLQDMYSVDHLLLNESLSDTIKFDGKTTDLNALLGRIDNIYEDQNLGAVVMITDGIINQGMSPAYSVYPFPVYSIGLGDTIPPKDLSIKIVRSNRVAYQGNQFPINITLSQKGFDDSAIKITILEGNKVVAEQELVASGSTMESNFLLNAEKPGLRRLTIQASKLEGESTYANNQQQLYIDVIEGKDKVLILAPAPHPDINAIRSVLSQTSNYETTLYIPGIHQKPNTKNFDVIIEMQAFSGMKYGDYESAGKWYIMGNKSNQKLMSQEITFLSIAQKNNTNDLVRGSYNTNFTKFKLDNGLIDRLDNYPPINVPFGDYQIAGPVEVMLYQKVGSITTERPLLAAFDDGAQKSVILTGSGIWQWKLQELGKEENSKLFESIVQKTVQYLSIKVNKDRFVAKPRQVNYQIGDRVFLDTEVYNDIYERSFGNTISLMVTNESGQSTNYEMVDSPVNSSFNLGSLAPGIYNYAASTLVDQKSFRENGTFVVRDIQIEKINITANHQLLKSVSQNTGGKYYHFSEAAQTIQDLKNAEFKNVIHTSKNDFPLIDSLWIILLIISTLGTEWFLRKYLGAY